MVSLINNKLILLTTYAISLKTILKINNWDNITQKVKYLLSNFGEQFDMENMKIVVK